MTETLILDLPILHLMVSEFRAEFDKLFDKAFVRLSRALKVKLEAIKYCQALMDEANCPNKDHTHDHSKL